MKPANAGPRDQAGATQAPARRKAARTDASRTASSRTGSRRAGADLQRAGKGVPDYRPVPAGFFSGGTVAVARALLGKLLVSDSPEGRTIGRIVETEAYLCDDAACHASRGETKRNRAMFGPPGRSYTYLIYGMYRCFNVVTAPAGTGEAVLIRALEPLEGLELMARRRGLGEPKALCSGPGKLVIALGIGDLPDGSDLRKGPLLVARETRKRVIESGDAERRIKVTTRIGISKDAHLPLRFYLEGNPWISRR